MTVVYIDSVFVLNALMDYLLVLSTARLAGIPLRRWRYLLSAVLGGAYAVSVFLPGCQAMSGWPAKAAAGVVMALTAYGGQKHFLRLVLLLLGVSCGFAGCVLALGFLSGGGIPAQNGIFYTNVDVKVLLIGAGAAYLVTSAVFHASARHGVHRMLTPVTLYYQGRSVCLTALCDTGNCLTDPATNRPLLVVCGAAASDLWPPETRRMLTPQTLRSPVDALEELNRHETRFHLIPYSAVGVSGGLLLAFRCDRAVIGRRKMDGLLVALSPTELGSGYAALWGEEGEEYGQMETPAAAAAGKAGPAEKP